MSESMEDRIDAEPIGIFNPNPAATTAAAGAPLYSNPAVTRPKLVVSVRRPDVFPFGDTILGRRFILHSGDVARWRIMAGWLVVLMYFLPVAR